ncbi:COG4280 domain-containing protein, partial [Candidatus Gracilibacteria bacterium]|nr:COG4280 domain-containing protein [Candidatus Gracilibacteria bacterium]
MNTGVFIGAFTGSLIELVEILAVALVVGRVAGWRNAWLGTGSAAALVIVGALIVGTGLTRIPERWLEIVAGLILLGFGQWWVRGVVKYYAGRLAPHEDEDLRLAAQLQQTGRRVGWNWVAVTTAFKSSLLESFEIALVVVTLGAANAAWGEAIGGALVATIGLVAVAFLLRAPLSRVPVKPMKFVAAMLLMGFGSYWLGAGLGLAWPTGAWAILWLTALWGVGMALAARWLRRPPTTPAQVASGVPMPRVAPPRPTSLRRSCWRPSCACPTTT